MVIWLIGKSGVGKTTIGRKVYEQWKSIAPNTIFVDGDEIRRVFQHDRSEDAYSVDGRKKNADRIAALCEWLDRQNVNVVACVLSMFHETQQWNRETYSKYFEVFIDVPLEVLIERDIKNLYKPAIEGKVKNVVGIDIPFEPPLSPDLTIDNRKDGIQVEVVAHQILKKAHVLTHPEANAA